MVLRSFFSLSIFIILLVTLTCCDSKHNNVGDSMEIAEEVKQEFLHSWKGYKKYAWGMDELKPLSKSFHNWDEVSLLRTPVDAYDTMLLMGLTEEAKEAKGLILSRLDFNQDIYVSVFEVTLRFMGGLISAYQMDGDPRFLALAKNLADRLLPAFESPTGLVWAKVNLRTGEVKGEINNPAEIGSLLLEFGTLSKLTGNSTYYQKAKNAVVSLYNCRSAIGLVGTTINIQTGKWLDATSHVGGCIDSYYEYLLKAWLLFGDKECKQMWESSINAINNYLLAEEGGQLWYGYVNMNTGKKLQPWYGSLDAHFPSVLALSGDLSRAKKLQESCYTMWGENGIAPEHYNFLSKQVVWGHYFLRPEGVEAAFYLYKLTGDKKYQQMGQRFFKALKKNCRTDAGYAELKDVNTMEKNDAMQSFFLSETLKYLYLLFETESPISLKRVTFNSEGHPFFKTWN